VNQGRTVLALGGGGARGVAHLGVLQVLEHGGVAIDRIVGVSMGSLMGAAYAFEPDIEKNIARMRVFVSSERFQEHQRALQSTGPHPNEEDHEKDENGSGFLWFNSVREYLRANRLFKRAITKRSLLSGKVLVDAVEGILPDADIAEAKIPLTIVAIDLLTGRRVVLEKGSLRDAVRGSASLPGIFPPVELDGKLLADIGIFSPLPTHVARYYSPDLLVASDVSPEIGAVKDCDTALDVMMRMEEVAGTVFRDHVLSLADVVIHPDVGDLTWSDFSTADTLIDRGREAAQLELSSIVERQEAERTSREPIP